MLPVLIAAGLMTVIALGSASLMVDMNRANNHSRQKSQMEALHEEIRALLSNSEACFNTIGAVNLPTIVGATTSAVNEIRDGRNEVRFDRNGPYGDRSTRISSMVLRDFVAGVGVGGELSLQMTYVTVLDQVGTQENVRTINISTTRDMTSGALRSCVAMAKMSDGLWQRSVANNRNIHYNGGMVGIGLADAVTALSIETKAPLGPYWGFDGVLIRKGGTAEPGIMLTDQNGKERGIFGLASAPGHMSHHARPGDLVMRALNGRMILSSDSIDAPPYPPAGSTRMAPARLTLERNGDVVFGDGTDSFSADGLGPRFLISGQTSENSDPIYLQRNNFAIDRSELRLVIGDNVDRAQPGSLDRLVVGATDASNANRWVPQFSVTSDGQVGIGTDSPDAKLDIHGADSHVHLRVINTSSATRRFPAVSVWNFTESADGHPHFMMLNARGTSAAAASLRAGDLMGALTGWGYVSPIRATQSARIDFIATQNWSPSNSPSAITFATSPPGIVDDAQYIERMRITDIGYVGIGTSAPDQRFVVANGATTGRYTTAGWTHVSDARLKRDIAPLVDPLRGLLTLRGVTYTYVGDQERTPQIGLLAQDVEKVFPQAVMTDAEGYKSLSYGSLIAPVIEALKELYRRLVAAENKTNVHGLEIENLKSRLLESERAAARLARENEELRLRLEAIEARVLGAK